ncbi:hypothetical protein LG276_20275 [Cytobacillus kochii]|uniref:hypothetical protein n=1 Tax=Cytobacillus kochii TaxID=859143 RepID=UPI001CD3ECA9|nr:hypothetical protein [Cytobacillus kochii]MCA1026804.1 hypothetical protein [Cytobacillus kochii]
MTATTDLIVCTRELLLHLNQGLPEHEREAYIKKTDDLLDQRFILMKQVDFQSTEAQKMKDVLLKQDRAIKQLLDQHQQIIKDDIKRLKVQKVKSKQYANPYEAVGMSDGVFYDKRN